MIPKLAFALHQFLLLGAFVVVAFGLARPLLGRDLGLSSALRIPLQLAAGLGLTMMALFAAGVFGLLNGAMLAILALVGVALALGPVANRASTIALRATLRSSLQSLRQLPGAAWWWVVVAVLMVVPLLIRPLRPPLDWDELAYHLPHARFWAEQGALTVNTWFRYPLSAYNMDLLYSAALILGSDVLPHLLHALTAALTALLTFAVARRFLDAWVGLVAAGLVLYSTRWGWSNAYVDLGLMLFWSCAFACLALLHAGADRRFAYLAAFFAGIAVGVKYQGLFYLPVFLALALTVERRPTVILRAVLIFIPVGSYWYLRNYSVSGDPLHPIGGPLFGFWLWSPADLAGQYDDLDSVRGWRDWLFLPALGAPLLWRGAEPFLRGLTVCAGAALALWFVVSGYWRYALPVYPILALLAGSVLVEAWRRSGLAGMSQLLWQRLGPRIGWGLAALILILVAWTSARDLSKAWARVLPDGQERAEYLAEKFPGYALIRSVGDAAPDTLYQLGFEGETYYLGRSIRGDWFGPGRYADVIDLAGDAGALARHLGMLGADGLLVNSARSYFSDVSWDPALSEHFDLIGRTEQGILYRLRNPVAVRGNSAHQPQP